MQARVRLVRRERNHLLADNDALSVFPLPKALAKSV